MSKVPGLAAASPNAAQIEYWNASAGETWAEHHDALDRQIAPLGSEALRRLAPVAGERVLDVGCGCGHTTVELASRVGPAGSVVGIDVSAPMLGIARQRTLPATAARVEFRRLDAQAEDLGRGAFDAAFSRFGVMFFSDPVAAFANLRRALRPAGRLGFVCWRPLDENRWMAEPMQAARPFLPPMEAPDPLAPGPFAFADGGRLARILAEAGYTEVSIQPFDAVIGAGDLEQSLALTLKVGPLGAALREHPDRRPLLRAAVKAVLERHLTAEGVRMPAAVWIVTARSTTSAG